MRVWVNTEALPVALEVEQVDDVYLYQGNLVNAPVFMSYAGAVEHRITEFETKLVILKSELKRNQLLLGNEHE